MTSMCFCFNLLTLFNSGIDTIKIPAFNSSVFEKSVNIVSGLYPSGSQNDSLVSVFNNRILFKEFYIEKKLYPDICNRGKISVFIGCRNDSISIGCDLNENNRFEAKEIIKMPANDKSVVSYIIYPKSYCNINSFADSTVIHLVPFVNQVRYANDLSTTDTMLQISISKGFSKKYVLSDTLTLSSHIYSINKFDSVYVHNYIVQGNSDLYALYPDRDLLRVNDKLYSIVQSFKRDTLYLVSTNGSSEYKISSLPTAFFNQLNLVKLSNKERGEVKFKKKYILLDFWATWCVPCIKSMPYLDEIEKKIKQKIQTISFCVDESKNIEEAQKIIKKNKLKWEHFFVDSKEGKIYDFIAGYGIIAFPTYILIDDKGNIFNLSNDVHKINFPDL